MTLAWTTRDASEGDPLTRVARRPLRPAGRPRHDRTVQLERSVRFAEELTRGSEDSLEEVIERYPTVRRFAPTFLAAFTFHAARASDPLLGAVDALRRMYVEGRSMLPKRVPTTFLKPRWRKVVFMPPGGLDRRAYEIAVIVHLRERRASGSIWVDGSRTYRTLDDYLLPQPAFTAMRDEGRLGLAVAHGFQDWHEDRREQLTKRMNEVEHAAAAGELVDAGGGERFAMSEQPLTPISPGRGAWSLRI